MKKHFFKFRKLSLYSSGLVALVTSFCYCNYGLSSWLSSNNLNPNSAQITNSNLNADTNTSVSNITGFNSYQLLSYNKLIKPVSTNYGVIGMTPDLKSLALTTFDGILVWQKAFITDSNIINFCKQNYPSQNVNDLVINNFVYLQSSNMIAILLGTSSYQNQMLFALDIQTGTFSLPTTNFVNIVKINNGIKYLFLNSANAIIATSGGNYSRYASCQYITVNASTGISLLPLVFSTTVAKSQADYLLTLVIGSNNVNFAVFISNSVTNTNQHQVYAVAIDDNLSPLTKNGTPIRVDVGQYVNNSNPTNSATTTLNWDDILTYQPQTTVVNTSISFYVVISGSNSGVYLVNYNPSNLELKVTSSYVSTDNSFGFFIYNPKTYQLFISNKKSKSGIASGYLVLNQALTNSSLKTLENDMQSPNWNSTTYLYTDLSICFPIISSVNLAYPDPYIVMKNNTNPSAKYFVSSTEIQNKPLIFKSYSDPQTYFKSNYASQMLNYTSQINNNTLIASLKFSSSDSTFKPTITIKNRVNDDTNGILKFQYVVTYSNWYSVASSTSSFLIDVTIDGFYAKSQFNFNFVTGLNGDTNNDKKWNNIVALMKAKSATSITANDVITNFINYDITDKNKNKVTITASMVNLQTNNNGYSLTVTINITPTNLFPNSTTTQFSYQYNGFKTSSGYEFDWNSNPSDFDKLAIFPSQLTIHNFLSYFVTLGSSWSENESDYSFTIVPNNLEGSATVSLTYTGNNSDFPEGMSKNLIVNQTISGFLSIPSMFVNKASIKDITTVLKPTQLWQEYLDSPSTSALFSSLNFPYIANNADLNIECTNLTTCDTDNYLDLAISIKLNTTTSLYIDGNFVYDANADAAFKKINANVFNLKWNVTPYVQDFNWINSSGQTIDSNSNSLQINLLNQSFNEINSNMLASQVTENDIKQLFNQKGYDVTISLNPNDDNGTLAVIINLKTSQDANLVDNTTQTKSIDITGFKIEEPGYIKYLAFGVAAIVFVLIIAIVVLLVYKSKKQKVKKIKLKNKF